MYTTPADTTVKDYKAKYKDYMQHDKYVKKELYHLDPGGDLLEQLPIPSGPCHMQDFERGQGRLYHPEYGGSVSHARDHHLNGSTLKDTNTIPPAATVETKNTKDYKGKYKDYMQDNKYAQKQLYHPDYGDDMLEQPSRPRRPGLHAGFRARAEMALPPGLRRPRAERSRLPLERLHPPRH